MVQDLILTFCIELVETLLDTESNSEEPSLGNLDTKALELCFFTVAGGVFAFPTDLVILEEETTGTCGRVVAALVAIESDATAASGCGRFSNNPSRPALYDSIILSIYSFLWSVDITHFLIAGPISSPSPGRNSINIALKAPFPMKPPLLGPSRCRPIAPYCCLTQLSRFLGFAISLDRLTERNNFWMKDRIWQE